MSRHHLSPFECPKCKTEYEIKVWESLNAELSPDAKIQLLEDKLFTSKCPNCSADNTVIYPILYHDMKNKTMIQLVFNTEGEESFRNTINKIKNNPNLPDIAVDSDYSYRVVFNANDFMEKIYILENNLDDRVIEIVKLVIKTTYVEKNPEINDSIMLFDPVTPYRLAIFINGKGTYSLELDMALYDKLAEAYKSKITEKSVDIMCINQNWAISVLDYEDEV